MSAPLPSRCPACGGPMEVEKLHCAACDTSVQGRYAPCPVCTLEPGARKLFDLFLRARGNLKEVQRALGVSYPTVRARMEELFARLEGAPPAASPAKVLGRVRRGELTVAQAEALLRGVRGGAAED